MMELNIKKITKQIEHIKRICHENNMLNAQVLQAVIAFTMIRRIDCLIGHYADISESFFLANVNRLHEERMKTELQAISGGFPFYNVSGYRISSVLISEWSAEVVFNSYLHGFSQNVQSILEGLDFERLTTILSRQTKHLTNILQSLEYMDLSSSVISNEEFTELILSLVSKEQIRGKGATAFTSQPLACLMSECLFAGRIIGGGNYLSVYDPVCGIGSLLITAGRKAKKESISPDEISLYGQDIALSLVAVSKALLLLSGDNRNRIEHGDTLSEDKFPNMKFQYIVADMPFGMSWRNLRNQIVHEGLWEKDCYRMGVPNDTSDSQFLFISHIISKMDSNGCRAAFTSTNHVLQGGRNQSGESQILRWLFEKDMVETIIALPAKMSTQTSAPVYMWILTNCKELHKKGKVQLINGKSGGDILNEYKQYVNNKYSQILPNDGFGMYNVYIKIENQRKLISISLDTKIEEYIDKNIRLSSNQEITIDYRSVEKNYVVKFADFFDVSPKKVKGTLKMTEDKVNAFIDSVSSLKTKIEETNIALDEIVNKATGLEGKKELLLHSFADVIKGQSKPQIEDDENGIPFVDVNGLRNNLSFVERFVPKNNIKLSTVDDVLVISNGQNAGEVFKGVNGIVASTLLILRPNNDIVLPRYLYYLMKGNESKLRALVSGSTVPALSVSTIGNLKCKLPPLQEQQRMVEILDAVVNPIDDIIKQLGNSHSIFDDYRQFLIEKGIG